MLANSFLYLQGIVAVIILQKSAAQEPSNRYSSFYNYDTKESGPTNIFDTAAAILNFVDQSENYLKQQVTDSIPENGAIYDFIIVGAGTAGSVIAARLSEIPDVKVLLIEAGPHETLFMDIPIAVHFLQLSDDINWKYRTKPSNKYCLGMHDNRCNFPRGKVMGGSSVLNYMIATRSGAEDYDRWANMGNDGWAYKDVLKYFKRMETIDIPEMRSDSAHGTDGPLHISYPAYQTSLATNFLRAGEELGYPIPKDYNNGKNMIGFAYLQSTIMNGTRMSSNRAYLQPIRHRSNLYLIIEGMVRKVLINRDTNRAVGVEFTKNGRNISVFARKEVILCAGAIGSPQLLMLSGIGPAEHLTELGIDVIQNAPVGENLMDHVAYAGLSWTIDKPIAIELFNILNPSHSYLIDFFTRRSGPLTVPGACEALAFINTKNPKTHTGLPDIELLFIGGAISSDIFVPITIGLNTRIQNIWQKYQAHPGWTILPMLLKPKSRGRIRLLANDVNVKPEITPNYFDDPDDVRTMIAGIKAGLRVGRTKAMQTFNSRLMDDIIPGCENYKYNSYAYWECAIRTLSMTIYHYSGTCKMGPRKDPTAVVDPKLKVIGVERLRVADASIMPEIISAHTNIPVYMIAEKLADMIKEEWGYLKSRS